MKIFSIGWLKTAAIANLSHFSRGCMYRYRRATVSCRFLIPPSLFLHSKIFCFMSRSYFEFIVLHRSLSLLLFSRPLIVVSPPAHTYLCVLQCCFYRITLCPSALFVRLCTLLIRAANRIRIRLNLSPLADVSLPLHMH